MKGTRIVFRLTPYQLARGLQTIKQLDPKYKLLSLNDIVKTIYHDYLAKMTLNRLDEVPAEITNEITSFIDRSVNNQVTLKELIYLKSAPKQELEDPKEQIDLSDEILTEINKLANQPKASNFNDPNKTDSDISSITDFSPPKDWKE